MRVRYPELETVVVRRCPAGHPLVLRCRPVFRRNGRLVPFPTLYWLACDALHRRIARLEAAGWIARMRRIVQADAALLRRLERDHRTYARERRAALRPEERRELAGSGALGALLDRGIGGISAPDRIKCLHLHVAHHLARGNIVGERVLALLEAPLCPTAGVAPGARA